jgi:hypothetical protein
MKNTKKNEKAVAYHEAGHAVVGWKLFGLRRVKKMTIIPKKNSLGQVKNRMIMRSIDYEVADSPAFDGKVMREIMGCYAGHVAEKKLTKKANNMGASQDFRNAVDLAFHLYGASDEKLLKHLQNYLYRRTELLIDREWNLVKAVARELLRKKILDSDDFYKITEEEFKKEIKRPA